MRLHQNRYDPGNERTYKNNKIWTMFPKVISIFAKKLYISGTESFRTSQVPPGHASMIPVNCCANMLSGSKDIAIYDKFQNGGQAPTLIQKLTSADSA